MNRVGPGGRLVVEAEHVADAFAQGRATLRSRSGRGGRGPPFPLLQAGSRRWFDPLLPLLLLTLAGRGQEQRRSSGS